MAKQKRQRRGLQDCMFRPLWVAQRSPHQRRDRLWRGANPHPTSLALAPLHHPQLNRPNYLQPFQRARSLSPLLLHHIQPPGLMTLFSHRHPLLAWMTQCPTCHLHLQKVSWKSSPLTHHPHTPVEPSRTAWERTPSAWRRLRSRARSLCHRYESLLSVAFVAPLFLCLWAF